jgi:hypothetical protein
VSESLVIQEECFGQEDASNIPLIWLRGKQLESLMLDIAASCMETLM